MMESPIDLQPVIDQLQSENERLRIYILKMRYQAPRIALFNGPAVRSFVVRNYILISASVLLLFAALSFVDTVRGFWPAPKKGNHA